MEKYERRSMEEEMNREAEEIEKEISEMEESELIEPTPEMDAKLLEAIQRYEQEKKERGLSEEDREALRIGREVLEKRKVRRMPRKGKVWVALVAVLVLVLAVGMTSVGSRSYLKSLWDRMIGSQKVEVTNVEDMEKQETEDLDELAVYKEIEEKTGIVAVQLRAKPQKMFVDSYEIDGEQKRAKIFYSYNGNIITYSTYVYDNEISSSNKMEDKLVNQFIIENETQKIEVKEYEIQNKKEHRYIANYSYKGAEYELRGIVSREELEKILKNLNYLS